MYGEEELVAALHEQVEIEIDRYIRIVNIDR